MKQLNISKMKINNEHIIKRPYVIPSFRVREMNTFMTSTSVWAGGGDMPGDGDNTRPTSAKDRGFYSSEERNYQGYGSEW